jgi:hypothetical protein
MPIKHAKILYNEGQMEETAINIQIKSKLRKYPVHKNR